MKHFRVIMYKAKWFDGHKIDNLIDVWTCLVNLPYVTWKAKFNPKEIWKFIRMNYAHVEIWEPHNFSHKSVRSCDWWNGYCKTSTMRDEYDGTVKRPARRVLTDVDRWDYAEFEVSPENYLGAAIWSSYQLRNNLGYSKKDICKFFPVVRHFVSDPDRNICSEFTHNYMVAADIFRKFKVISPRLLAWLIYKQLGKEFKSVKGA